MRNRITTGILLAVCIAALTASPAIAGTTGDDPYRTNGENVAGALQGGGGSGGADNAPAAGTVATDDGSSLPFTGLDVALIFGVGGLLLAVGLGTRRLTRHADPA